MSSDAGCRLRRAKSTSSVQKRRQVPPMPEHLDPEVAKRHAMAAASHAMLRASERSSNESRGSWDNSGGSEKTGHLAIPPRRRSLRPSEPDQPFSQFSQVSHADAPVSGPLINSMADDHSDSILLASISEFQGFPGGDSSLPSSYRRLRKAKSMFSTRHRTTHPDVKSPPIPDSDCFQPRKTPDDNRSHRSLRRSMSFLRGSQYAQAVRRTRSQDAAIQLARDKFFEHQDAEEQERRPSIFAKMQRREQKPFRKTVRPGRDTTPDDDLTSPQFKQYNSSSFHTKARAFSASVKSRLRRVFGRSKVTEEHSPIQHEQRCAAESHVGDYEAESWEMEPSNQTAICMAPGQ
jgi:hypothetical protein